MSDYYTQNLFFYKESIERLEQAIFFCYDEFNNKLPVGLINSFVFDEDNHILFNVKWFPNPETVFNSFDSELWFYKKGESYHLTLTGIANITIADKVLVKFTITHIECLGKLPEEDTSLHSRFMSFIKNILNFENAAKIFG